MGGGRDGPAGRSFFPLLSFFCIHGFANGYLSLNGSGHDSVNFMMRSDAILADVAFPGKMGDAPVPPSKYETSPFIPSYVIPLSASIWDIATSGRRTGARWRAQKCHPRLLAQIHIDPVLGYIRT